MASTYEVVIAGGGHNGLTVAAYLAKAGVSVAVVEARDYVGGGVASQEVAAPGFVTDIASVGHMMIQANPIVTNDELGLISKYGLKYIVPEKNFVGVFPDDSYICVDKSVEDTCQSIAKFSEKDAEAYYRFFKWGESQLNMIVAGMYQPPASWGALNTMMESSVDGRKLLHAMYVSGHDLALEWFEDPHTINMIDRICSERMMLPSVDGSGYGLLLIVPFMHMFGCGVPEGGSGALTQALVRSIEDRGGVIRTNAKVKQFKVSGGRCTGVILENGEEITATRAVVTNFHIQQLNAKMLGTDDLPEEYTEGIKHVRFQQYQAYLQGLALEEAPQYNAGPEVDEHLLVEFLPDTIEDFDDIWNGYLKGIPTDSIPLCVTQSRFDPTRAPAGKHTQYLYEYAPYKLAGGKSWDDIKEEVGDRILDNWLARTKNLTRDKIIGRWKSTPLDFERSNDAWPQGSFHHVSMHLSQSMSMRPFPLVGRYRLPVDGLYLCGPSSYPGGGACAGARAAVYTIFEDLDIDFDDVIYG